MDMMNGQKMVLPSLPETSTAPEKIASQKERIVFQPSILRGELLVSGRVIKSVSQVLQ